MNSQDDVRPRYPMNRRAFVSLVAAGAASTLIRGSAAATQPVPKARNVVLVHGLFADGSCWSEVIARLQAAGLNATAVQNPLTTLPEAVASAERVLARQDGPTVLVGHSFSGMIVTEAGMHPNVRLLSMWRRGRRTRARITRRWPRHFRRRRRPPGSSSTAMKAVSARLRSCAISRATCRKRRRRFSMRSRSRSTRLCSRARPRTRPGGRSRVSMPFRRKTGRSIPISNASWPSAWAPRPSK